MLHMDPGFPGEFYLSSFLNILYLQKHVFSWHMNYHAGTEVLQKPKVTPVFLFVSSLLDYFLNTKKKPNVNAVF